MQQVQPYLFFDGRCEEAAEFYRSALGAEITSLLRFKDAPPPKGDTPPSAEGCGAMTAPPDKVMHMSMRIGSTELMASDGQCVGQPNFQGFSLSIQASDAEEAERLFGALADGGQVQMPLGPTFFASRFGMVADRFGVSWMVLTQP
ncbi:VOC family protein [Caldimonas brevitalea]|uniref:3-demethylubiquinone-9 3-methyltransferase n=1 Tax=Caldimonas brevitalea TaxID=413882 RepID=A0A0G3BLT4_9BURK|nr:VOC family protein [Caldimonas brevitalea]AKJ27520.1 3-demethylubiquinone-9 3-methyltransferase [Caldimonas brevitalea]